MIDFEEVDPNWDEARFADDPRYMDTEGKLRLLIGRSPNSRAGRWAQSALLTFQSIGATIAAMESEGRPRTAKQTRALANIESGVERWLRKCRP